MNWPEAVYAGIVTLCITFIIITLLIRGMGEEITKD